MVLQSGLLQTECCKSIKVTTHSIIQITDSFQLAAIKYFALIYLANLFSSVPISTSSKLPAAFILKSI